jgi:hypothetical protein
LTWCRLVREPRARNQATAVAHPARRILGPLARQLIVPAPLEPPSAPTPRTGDGRRTPRLLVPAEDPCQNASGHPNSCVGRAPRPSPWAACSPPARNLSLHTSTGRTSSYTARTLAVSPHATGCCERQGHALADISPTAHAPGGERPHSGGDAGLPPEPARDGGLGSTAPAHAGGRAVGAPRTSGRARSAPWHTTRSCGPTPGTGTLGPGPR